MRTELTLVILLLVPALLLLGQSLSYGFMSDDFHLLYRVEREGFFYSWGGEEGSAFFRPVTVLSYFLDNRIWGLNPTGYHITSILWHLLCSALVYRLAQELFRDRTAAFCSGYLFLLLTCHSESVAWISGRTDLIATAFALWSMILLLRKNFLAVPVFATGLLAKESIIIVPLLWLLLLIVREDWRSRRSTLLVLSGLMVSAFYTESRLLFSPGLASGLESTGISAVSIFEMAGNFLRYSFRVFVPPLPLFLRSFVLNNPLAVPVFLLALCSAMLIVLKKRGTEGKTKIALLAGCFIVSLLPVILMKVSLFDSRSERFLYLPGVFAVLVLVQWVLIVIRARRTAAIMLLLFALFQGVFLLRSFGNWQIAGEMCREIVSSGSTETPDNYNGAYVFRNGYDEAVLILGE